MTCPKCGDDGWKGPTYECLGELVMGTLFGEALVYKCSTCGFKRREPTKDAQTLGKPAFPPLEIPAEPPQPPAWANPNVQIHDEGPRWIRRIAHRIFGPRVGRGDDCWSGDTRPPR